ncbi:hypothetical protein ACSBR2_035369 [Camellia fascicularis]
MNIIWWRNNEGMLRMLYVLFLGQVVSFIMALASFTSSLVANLGVDTPLTLSSFGYLSLALVYGSILLYRRQQLLVPWYWYVLLGFIDVQGNYLFNKAYEYSSITSVTLLDCWTIPWVIVLTWFIMATRYSLWQLFGAAICVTGLCLVLLSDAGVGGGGGSKPLLGDLLVIAATLFYAMSNVGEILAFAGYALSFFMFYSFVPFVLKMSGATMFNLSILTSDMWAVVIRIFFYHQQVDWLYYLSFAIEVVGLVMYSKTEKDPIPAQALADGNLDAQYQVLGEESAESTNEVIAS